ncbi:MAG: hypothetical protein D3923_04935, partial [Candidatus Electrothrix sp. AR3]|nr:hypothetical protein [Candidatus Electrothrix sp. AR3]
ELYEADPTNASFKNGLAISFFKLGELHLDKNDIKEARSYFLKTKKILEELSKSFPAYLEFSKNLVEVKKALSKLK